MSFLDKLTSDENSWLWDSPRDIMMYAADHGNLEFCTKFHEILKDDITFAKTLIRMNVLDSSKFPIRGNRESLLYNNITYPESLVMAIPHARNSQALDFIISMCKNFNRYEHSE